MFRGLIYRLSNNWNLHVKLDDYQNRPIKYLEIGTFYGANLLDVAKTYAGHEKSELHCIDPWIDYEEYPEYKGTIQSIFDVFMSNVDNSPNKNKITIHRGFSNEKVPLFEDNYFDIIYIDGNHEPEYVMEDAVLSFRKLKSGGIMIFDDYNDNNFNYTKMGIDSFVKAYFKRITNLGEHGCQLFVKKN